MIGATITGDKEIIRLFKQLETKESAKACRKGTRETQKETVLPDAKSNATSMVGGSTGAKLAKALAVRAMTKMKRGHYGAKVILKPTDSFVVVSKDGKRYYIPNAIEYGHGYPGRSGNKDVKPIPFMRNAYEKHRVGISSKLSKKIMKHLNESIKRGSQK